MDWLPRGVLGGDTELSARGYQDGDLSRRQDDLRHMS